MAAEEVAEEVSEVAEEEVALLEVDVVVALVGVAVEVGVEEEEARLEEGAVAGAEEAGVEWAAAKTWSLNLTDTKEFSSPGARRMLW